MAKVTGSCPTQGSGQFYVCQGNTTEFIGCCTTDPCADGSGNCPSSDLGYTSFDADSYDDILPQTCASAGLWYTCEYTPIAFMGCCLTNPCAADGCFGSNITAAVLSANATEAAPFVTSTATVSSSDNDDSSSVSTGGIVGIAIGSAMGALILGIILFTLYKRHRKNKENQSGTLDQPDPDGTPGMYMPSPYQDSTGFPSPPAQYYGGFETDKSFSYPNSPGQVGQRPTSVAPSWLSGTASGPAHSSHPSVSSMGSSQGGLHFLFNQQRSQQHLNTVSEMDGTQVARPLSELPGSTFPNQEDHVYKVGYNRVATGERKP